MRGSLLRVSGGPPNPPPRAGGGSNSYFAPGAMMARTSAMISGGVA
jgi:hypothetical protein